MPSEPRFLDHRSPPHIATLVMIAGVSALSMNIFLPSLPGMAVYFDVPYGVMQQSISLYMLLSATLQIIIGPLSDRFGRRPVLLTSCFLFLLFSIGTLIAPTAGIFLLCRMGQAVIASGTVLARAIVRDVVPEEEAASKIAYVTMGMSLVPMIGPVIGGFLDEAFGWHANFALLLIAGIVTFGMLYFDLAETARPSGNTIWGQFKLYPLLFTSVRFWGYSLSAGFLSGTFFAYLGGAPFVGKDIFHLSSAWVGSLFALSALGYALGNWFAGRWSMRIGMNRMILLGAVIAMLSALALVLLKLMGVSHAAVFFGTTTILGIGNGIGLPNANAGMVSVRPELAGTASGLGGAILIGGGAALAALAGAVLHPGSSEMPLLLIMFLSGLASVLSILLVMRRAKNIGITS